LTIHVPVSRFLIWPRDDLVADRDLVVPNLPYLPNLISCD